MPQNSSAMGLVWPMTKSRLAASVLKTKFSISIDLECRPRTLLCFCVGGSRLLCFVPISPESNAGISTGNEWWSLRFPESENKKGQSFFFPEVEIEKGTRFFFPE